MGGEGGCFGSADHFGRAGILRRRPGFRRLWAASEQPKCFAFGPAHVFLGCPSVGARVGDPATTFLGLPTANAILGDADDPLLGAGTDAHLPASIADHHACSRHVFANTYGSFSAWVIGH
jgi:hypothetical protein